MVSAFTSYVAFSSSALQLSSIPLQSPSVIYNLQQFVDLLENYAFAFHCYNHSTNQVVQIDFGSNLHRNVVQNPLYFLLLATREWIQEHVEESFYLASCTSQEDGYLQNRYNRIVKPITNTCLKDAICRKTNGIYQKV